MMQQHVIVFDILSADIS